MPYLDETGLAYYNEKLQSWIASQPVKTISTSLYPWALTAKAGAVTCWPVGGTPLKPTVDYIFTETPPANGQPKAPDKPSTITGVSSVGVTRCGENLFNIFGEITPTAVYSLPDADSDGYISISGTPNPSADASRARCVVKSDAILSDSIYTVVIEAESFVNCYLKFEYGQNLGSVRGQLNTGRVDVSTSGIHFITCTNNNQYNPNCILRLILAIPKANPSYSAKFRVSVFNGIVTSSSFVYAPYSSVDATINLGDTYYGGSIDLATGLMTVTHVAVTPDASTVDISSAPAALPLDYADTFGRTITSADGTTLAVGSAGGTVVYKLATPQAVQLDTVSISALSQPDKYTPRLNTIYTDAQAVQVGYVKSPIREEFELQQAIVSQGGNI